MDLNREKILFEMQRLGWNQSRLAKEMGVHRQALNKLLIDDTVGITLKTIDKFAKALRISPRDLIVG